MYSIFDSDNNWNDRFCLLLEKYTRGVSAVESILTLDRLRQSVAIKELEQSHGQSLSMRKTVSVPNFSQVPNPVAMFKIRNCDFALILKHLVIRYLRCNDFKLQQFMCLTCDCVIVFYQKHSIIT